jgi:hypothetical protein
MNRYHAQPLVKHYTITDRAFTGRIDFDAREESISTSSNDLLYTDRSVQFVRMSQADDCAQGNSALRLTSLRSATCACGERFERRYTSLPKRQTGREAGTQSNGSLRDSRATEEAPSADEPSVTTFGEGAV